MFRTASGNPISATEELKLKLVMCCICYYQFQSMVVGEDGPTGVTVLQRAVQVNVFVRDYVTNQNREMVARSVLVPVNKLGTVPHSLVQVMQ